MKRDVNNNTLYCTVFVTLLLGMHVNRLCLIRNRVYKLTCDYIYEHDHETWIMMKEIHILSLTSHNIKTYS